MVRAVFLACLAVAAFAAGPARADRVPGPGDAKAALYALSMAPAPARAAWRWRLARDYAAAGLFAEADGALTVLAGDSPARARTREFRLLRARVLIALGEPRAALDVLGDPIGEGAETCLQRLVAYARLGQSKLALGQAGCAEPAIAVLPARQRTPVLIAMARTSMALGETGRTKKLLGQIEAPNAAEAGEIAYWRGVIAARAGQSALALDHFSTAMLGANPVAALAARVGEVQLRVAAGTLEPARARAELSALRFAWRGGAAERALLLEIGRLSDRLGDRRGAFEAYGTVAQYLTADPALAETLSRRFTAIFADGGAALPPAQAFALFWDFRNYAPQGAAADAMVRRLVDRLAGLGLTGQAANLLEYQVDMRLEGAARSIVAAQLARLLVASGRPRRALAVLAGTEAGELPADALRSRARAKAAALIASGREADAAALLDGDSSPEAQRLRADAAWAARDWEAVIELAGGSLPPPAQAAAPAALAGLLKVAVAAVMTGDETLLRRLHRTYAQALAGTDMAEAFDALSGEPGTIPADRLRAALAAAAKRAAQASDSFGSDA